jgi:hypothetical protein
LIPVPKKEGKLYRWSSQDAEDHRKSIPRYKLCGTSPWNALSSTTHEHHQGSDPDGVFCASQAHLADGQATRR